jgi:hypothetical protein
MSIDELLHDLPLTWRVVLQQSDTPSASGKWWCHITTTKSVMTLALGPYKDTPNEALVCALDMALESDPK